MELVFSSTFTGVMRLELGLSDLHGKCFLSHLISSPPFFLCMYVCPAGSSEHMYTGGGGGRYKSQVFLPAQVLLIRLNLQRKLEWVDQQAREASSYLHLPRAGIASVCTWVCFHRALGLNFWFSYLHFRGRVISPTLRRVLFLLLLRVSSCLEYKHGMGAGSSRLVPPHHRKTRAQGTP